MFKVECESCKAPYDVDERRVPLSGMKMRCPKCGTSFSVKRPGATPPGPAAAPPGNPASSDDAQLPAPVAKNPRAATMMGMAPPKAQEEPALPALSAAQDTKPFKGTMMGIAPPVLPKIPSPGSGDADLPSAAKPAPIGPGTRAFGLPKIPKPAPPSGAQPLPPSGSHALPQSGSQGLPPNPARPATPAGGGLADLPAPAARPASTFGGASAFGREGPPSSTHALPPLAGAPESSPPVALDDDSSIDFDLPAPSVGKPAIPKPGAGKPPAPPPRPGAFTPSAFAIDIATDDGIDLPTPAAPAPAFGARPGAAAKPTPSGDFDLPAPKVAPKPPVASGSNPFGGEIDFDLPAPKVASGGLDIDLPQSKAHAVSGGSFDLPIASGKGLPMTSMPPVFQSDSDPPAVSPPKAAAKGGIDMEFDLPVPKKRNVPSLDADLPAPSGSMDLPAPRPGASPFAPSNQADPFAATGLGFGDLDLPTPSTGALDLPMPKPKVGFGDLDLPMPSGGGIGDLPRPVSTAQEFGEIDLEAPIGLGGGFGGDEFGAGPETVGDELELPQDEHAAHDSPDDSLDLDMRGVKQRKGTRQQSSTAEFEDVPQRQSTNIGDPNASPDVVSVERAQGTRFATVASRSKKPLYITLGTLAVLVGGGAALGATPLGFFGVSALERFMPGSGNPAEIRGLIARVEKESTTDLYPDYVFAINSLATARKTSGLNRELLCRSVVHEALAMRRFGDTTGGGTRIAGIMSRLRDRRTEGKEFDLAQAAEALSKDEFERAAQLAAKHISSGDAYAALLAAEGSLGANEFDTAIERFDTAVKNGAGARAQWGIVRALLAKNADPKTAIAKTLELSPRHVLARVAQARLLPATEVNTALVLLREAAGRVKVDGEPLAGAPREKVDALVALGQIQYDRGRLREAGESFAAATELEPDRIEALVGEGLIFMQQTRVRDALTRFEAAKSAPNQGSRRSGSPRTYGAEARLGSGRAKYALEQYSDAKAEFAALLAEAPTDTEVLLALGKAEAALADAKGAEEHFRNAIRIAPTQFDGYLALSQLFQKTNRARDAAGILEEADRKVPETSDVKRQMGDAALERDDLDRAIAHYSRSLELDRINPRSLFGLGVAYRRASRLDSSAEILERLAAREPDYPGLPLERGLVYEAQGRSEAAVRAFTRALENKPGNVDLMMRLGAAQVASGQIDAAEATLAKVLEKQPGSAEAVHFLGRVAFAREQFPEAAQRFEQALSMDATRAEYHFYAAWCALRAGNAQRANSGVDAALQRDPRYADAFWIRGELKARAGAARDALVDLARAVELKPGRIEALATMATAHEQLGQRGEAITALTRALVAQPQNGEWLTRLGNLHLDAGDAGPAAAALARAVELVPRGEGVTTPRWGVEAYRAYADVLVLRGNSNQAIEYYERFLTVAPDGDIDREDVRQKLRRLGSVPP